VTTIDAYDRSTNTQFHNIMSTINICYVIHLLASASASSLGLKPFGLGNGVGVAMYGLVNIPVCYCWITWKTLSLNWGIACQYANCWDSSYQVQIPSNGV